MPYCARCGVEVDKNQKLCPLCDAPIIHFDQNNRPIKEKDYPEDNLRKKLPYRRDIRRAKQLSVSILTVCFITPLIVVLAIDLRYEPGLSWSRIPVAILASLHISSILPLLIPPRFHGWALPISYYLIIAAALLGIDLADPYPSWAIPVALPIETAAALISAGIVWVSLRVKKLGSNLGAFILIGLTLLSAVIELIVRAHMPLALKLDWAFIVALILLPVTALLLYIHYILGKEVNLKKIFHI